MPLISVVIPVFNGEKTVKETIESVLNQTFTDLEVIIIDDGSRDSTLEIISNIQDSRIKVFSYQNSGVSVSRNRGFSHASGEFISFIDADDLWTPEKLENQLEALQANPQAAVAYSWVNHIDEAGRFLRPGNRIAIDGDMYSEMLVRNTLQNGSNPLIRRQALVKVGGFNQKFSPADDWEMWLRLAAHYHFVAVPSPQVLYRILPSSMSSNVEKMQTACLRVVETAFEQAPKSLQHLKKRSLASIYGYLTFKILEAPSTRRAGFSAIAMLCRAIVNDWSVLLQGKMLATALFKVVVVLLLPPKQSPLFVAMVKRTLKR